MKRDASTLLRFSLRANSVFSALSGIVILTASQGIAEFLGLHSGTELLPTGISLLGFSAWTGWLSFRREIPKLQVLLVISLDVLWVVGSALAIFMDPELLTTGGKWAVGAVAAIVMTFADLQTLGLVKLHRDRAGTAMS